MDCFLTIIKEFKDVIFLTLTVCGTLWGARIGGEKTLEATKKAHQLQQDAKNNERLLLHAIQTLERTYNVLISDNNKLSRKPRDWNVAAEFILDYHRTKLLIDDKNLKEECNIHEKYWRHQFNRCLSLIDLRFFDTENGAFTDELHPYSVVIVFHFATWPRGEINPLSEFIGVKDVDKMLEKFPIDDKDWPHSFTPYIDDLRTGRFEERQSEIARKYFNVGGVSAL